MEIICALGLLWMCTWTADSSLQRPCSSIALNVIRWKPRERFCVLKDFSELIIPSRLDRQRYSIIGPSSDAYPLKDIFSDFIAVDIETFVIIETGLDIMTIIPVAFSLQVPNSSWTLKVMTCWPWESPVV